MNTEVQKSMPRQEEDSQEPCFSLVKETFFFLPQTDPSQCCSSSVLARRLPLTVLKFHSDIALGVQQYW